jgi:hypothetical protein
MRLKRFKDFIKEEFLFNSKITPIDLHEGDYYTVDGIKGVRYIDIFGVKSVSVEVCSFEIESYDGMTDDRLYVLPEHVSDKIKTHEEEELKAEDLVKGELYLLENEFSGEYEGDAEYLGIETIEINMPVYIFGDDKGNEFGIPYNELQDRVKEDLVIQNKARRKYDLY